MTSGVVFGNACEFGTTYKDYYGKPDSYELAVSSDGGAYYFPNERKIDEKGVITIWERIHFERGMIEIYCGKRPPDSCPYVVYKGHRWYPQYHGFIYVYEDGKEMK